MDQRSKSEGGTNRHVIPTFGCFFGNFWGGKFGVFELVSDDVFLKTGSFVFKKWLWNTKKIHGKGDGNSSWVQIEWALDFVISEKSTHLPTPTYCNHTSRDNPRAVRRWLATSARRFPPSGRCVCWIGDLQQLVPTKLHSLSEYWQMLDIEPNSRHLHIPSPTQIR